MDTYSMTCSRRSAGSRSSRRTWRTSGSRTSAEATTSAQPPPVGTTRLSCRSGSPSGTTSARRSHMARSSGSGPAFVFVFEARHEANHRQEARALEDVGHHVAVARLEDVEREQRVREKDEVWEWKDRELLEGGGGDLFHPRTLASIRSYATRAA